MSTTSKAPRYPAGARKSRSRRHTSDVAKPKAPRYTAGASLDSAPTSKKTAEHDWIVLLMALMLLMGLGLVLAVCYILIMG